MSSIAFSFTGKNEAAQAAVDEYLRNYTWNISTETRTAINGIAERAIREGIPPFDAARLMKAHIGLDSRRSGALMTFRDKLVADGRNAATVSRATEKYGAKLLRSRAETIARTETMAALNAGQLSGMKEALAEDLLDPEDAGKEWMVTPDDALCEICAPMADESVHIDEPFSNGLDTPPAHPNCRCTIAPADEDDIRASGVRGRTVTPTARGAQVAAVAVTALSAINVAVGAGRLSAILEMIR